MIFILNKQGYEINPGDIVKLGRVEFRVIECKYYNKIKSMDDHSNNVNFN